MAGTDIARENARIHPLDMGNDAAVALGAHLSDQFGTRFNADRITYALQGPKALQVAVGIGALLQGIGIRAAGGKYGLQPIVEPRGATGATMVLASHKVGQKDLRVAAHDITTQLTTTLRTFGSPYSLTLDEVTGLSSDFTLNAVKIDESSRKKLAERHGKRLGRDVHSGDYTQRVTGSQAVAAAKAGRAILSATAGHQGYEGLRFGIIGEDPLYIASYATELSGVALRSAVTATYERANDILTQVDATARFAVHKRPSEPALPFLPVLA